MGASCEVSFRGGYLSVCNGPDLTKFVTDMIDRRKKELYNGGGDIPESNQFCGNQAKLIAEDSTAIQF